jgi:hypothetical protein
MWTLDGERNVSSITRMFSTGISTMARRRAACRVDPPRRARFGPPISTEFGTRRSGRPVLKGRDPHRFGENIEKFVHDSISFPC